MPPEAVHTKVWRTRRLPDQRNRVTPPLRSALQKHDHRTDNRSSRRGLVSHLSYVPNGYRNVAMLQSLPQNDREVLVERTKRDYQDMCRAEYDLPGLIKQRN